MTRRPTGDLIGDLEAQMGIVARRVRRVVAERATQIDPALSPLGYAVLEHLATQGPSRQTALVDGLGSEKGAVSRAVQQLVDLGLAERDEDPDDGRAQVVRVTRAGRKRLDALGRTRRVAYQQKLADWDDDDLAAFVDLLTRYNRSLEG